MHNKPVYFDMAGNRISKSLNGLNRARKIDVEGLFEVGRVAPDNSSRPVMHRLEQNREPDPAYRGLKTDLSSPLLFSRTLSEGFIRTKINRAFPMAEYIREEIAQLDYVWKEDFWFGPKELSKWVVKIGAEVAVEKAQKILSICLKHTDKISNVAIVYFDDEPQYRWSIWIGSEGFRYLRPRSQDELRQLLEPSLTRLRLHKLAAGFQE